MVERGARTWLRCFHLQLCLRNLGPRSPNDHRSLPGVAMYKTTAKTQIKAKANIEQYGGANDRA